MEISSCVVRPGITLVSRDCRYKVVGEIAGGAFATVFQANTCGRTVALKAQEPAEECAKEFAIMKACAHSNVMQLLDSFVICNTSVLVMPMYAMDLYSYMHSEGAVPDVAFAKDAALQLVNGLHAIESAGYVHNDLKPENIMIKLTPDVSFIIADFGTATKAGNLAPQYGHTIEYRSPEIILRHAVTPASDIWSLGAVIFQLLTFDYLFSPSEVDMPGFDNPVDDDAACDEMHLQLMVELLGTFPDQIAHLHDDLFQRDGELLSGPSLCKMSMTDVLQEYDYNIVDSTLISSFLQPMLQYIPSLRPTPVKIADHKWLIT